MNTYDVGDRVVMVGLFTDREGSPSDPSSVSIKVKKPDRSVTRYRYGVDADLTRIDAGHYEMQLDIDQFGTYYYYWYSTESGKAAGENSFEVRKSEVLFD